MKAPQCPTKAERQARDRRPLTLEQAAAEMADIGTLKENIEMPKLEAKSPRQQQLLKSFAGKLAAELNKLAPEVTGEVDYGMLAVPLIGLAVNVLKQRGLSRDEIEEMVMQVTEKQFSGGAPASPILTLVR